MSFLPSNLSSESYFKPSHYFRQHISGGDDMGGGMIALIVLLVFLGIVVVACLVYFLSPSAKSTVDRMLSNDQGAAVPEYNASQADAAQDSGKLQAGGHKIPTGSMTKDGAWARYNGSSKGYDEGDLEDRRYALDMLNGSGKAGGRFYSRDQIHEGVRRTRTANNRSCMRNTRHVSKHVPQPLLYSRAGDIEIHNQMVDRVRRGSGRPAVGGRVSAAFDMARRGIGLANEDDYLLDEECTRKVNRTPLKHFKSAGGSENSGSNKHRIVEQQLQRIRSGGRNTSGLIGGGLRKRKL